MPLLHPLVLALTAPAAAAEPALTLPHERYTLPNGLQVVLAPDPTVPFVWVNVWYHVGSKDEPAGRSGFAHLFEHLMFQGSENANDDFFKPLQKVGGQVNGTTNLDRTNYFEGVPAEQLPLALFLESDRMGWLLPSLTEERLQNQKDVVRNERRQRYDNVPYGYAWMLILENLFPEGHPYHIATIGRHEDIEAATLADVQAFFRTWYLPNNASLVICGDFDPKVAKKLVKGWFGPIPAGPEPVPAVAPGVAGGREIAPVALTEQKVVRATDDVPYEKVWIAWPTPSVYAGGDAELDLLSHALSEGKDSRLYRAIVHEKQLAQDIDAGQSSMRLQSAYILSATVAPGHTGDELIAAIDEVLADVRANGVTDEEVSVAKTAYEVGFYESLSSIQGKADRMNSYLVTRGDPDWVAEDLARYQAVDAQGVHDAMKTWLPADKRLILRIGPEEVKK